MLADSRIRTRNVRRPTPPANVRTGLFETDSDVRNYVRRVDAQVRTLQDDFIAWAVKKWGPNGFAASVTAEQLAAFKDDKAFYQAWDKWRTAWNAFRDDIDDTWFITLSANKYREVEKYDLEQQAWRKKLMERGAKVTGVTPTTPGTIPGITPPTNPDAPKAEGIPWTGILLVGGLFAAGSLLNGVRGR